MTPLEEFKLTLRETKVRIAWMLLDEVAKNSSQRWSERLTYAVEWLQGIECEMNEYYELKKGRP